MKVTIAGASGFIGKRLIEKLPTNIHIKALSRNSAKNLNKNDNLEFYQTDLFSLQSTTEALKNTDIAIYLVHSMLPSSRLFQGDFHDTDLILADNFATACLKNNVKQIIYLGGLVPDGKISQHLESRREVEEVFRDTKLPTTILRAGMIVGDGGSSFEILRNLVNSLPLMLLPSWTKSKTQAVYIDDLIAVLSYAIANQKFFDKTINVVNGESITYKDLIYQACARFNKSKPLIPTPINATGFSKRWVSLFGKTSYELVSPLIDSLVCDLPQLSCPEEISHLIQYRSFKQMLQKISNTTPASTKTKVFHGNTVRSIQRFQINDSISVKTTANLYLEWLPVFLKRIMKVVQEDNKIYFRIAFISKPLLILEYIPAEADVNRVKFHVTGGLLNGAQNAGWLEFRKIESLQIILSSINDFTPSLPWFIYIYTQAPFHRFVMNKFGAYMKEQKF
ncbi:MAG: NAD(P)H-binding protein [Bacteriovoracaceae bacterium]|nr:NAD(P)H-binding protein [Bacteriovoracaceae bacterium]